MHAHKFSFNTTTARQPQTTEFVSSSSARAVSSQNSSVVLEQSPKDVPGVWYSACQADGDWPCEGYCSSADTACFRSVSSIARTCGPSWKSYHAVQNGMSPAGHGWHNTTTVVRYTNPGGTRVTTVDVFTSFLNATEGVFVGGSTMTPVYALGSPVLSAITTSEPLYPQPTYTVLTGPTPGCKYTAYGRKDRSDCGRCTIAGATVDLYFWPPTSTAGITQTSLPQGAAQTTVMDGHTLVAPSVYISIHNLSATDACLPVGNLYAATLVAMDATDISTQIHVGGKAAAYTYGQLDYNDLTGLPPVSNYEAQPSCIYDGCPTIYYTSWNPTLLVPPQLRSIDPAWADCALPLEGFYDPPIALTARDAQVPASSSQAAGMPKASPHLAPQTTQPGATWTPTATLSVGRDSAKPLDSLATIVHSGLGTHSTRSTGRTAKAENTEAPRSSGHPSDPGTSIGQSRSSPRKAPTSIVQPDGQSREPVVPVPSERFAASVPTSQPKPTSTLGHTTQPVSVNVPFPHALSSGRGVVVGDHTMQPGEVLTLSNGPHATVVSVRKHKDSTFVVYDGATTLALQESSATGSREIASSSGELVSVNSKTQYVVDGQTLAPGSPITLTGDEGPVTFKMLTSRSSTFIAIGTTTTIPLVDSSSSVVPLAFTQASNGEFVLHGTTLAFGKPVTIGKGRDRTTLRMTTMSGVPAVVVDGATTKLLGHAPVASSAGPSASGSLPPIITHASAPPAGPASTSAESVTTSATSTSGASWGASKLGLRSVLMLTLLGFMP